MSAVKVNYTVRSLWNGQKVINAVKGPEAKQAVQAAVDYYKARLRTLLLRQRGSEPTTKVGFVRAAKFSKPGQAPYWQTGNLAESIKAKTEVQKTQIKGSVSTTVKYAKILEEGGLMPPKLQKRLVYTDLKLVNPINVAITVAPRPAWRPTFEKEAESMEQIIEANLKKAIEKAL